MNLFEVSMLCPNGTWIHILVAETSAEAAAVLAERQIQSFRDNASPKYETNEITVSAVISELKTIRIT